MVDWDHPGAEWLISIVYFVAMTAAYFYVFQPILVDFSPIFAYEGSARSGPRGSGELLYFVFLIGGLVIIGSVDYMISSSPRLFFANVGRIPLFLIPNRFLPEKYQPENMKDLQELENQDE